MKVRTALVHNMLAINPDPAPEIVPSISLYSPYLIYSNKEIKILINLNNKCWAPKWSISEKEGGNVDDSRQNDPLLLYYYLLDFMTHGTCKIKDIRIELNFFSEFLFDNKENTKLLAKRRNFLGRARKARALSSFFRNLGGVSSARNFRREVEGHGRTPRLSRLHQGPQRSPPDQIPQGAQHRRHRARQELRIRSRQGHPCSQIGRRPCPCACDEGHHGRKACHLFYDLVKKAHLCKRFEMKNKIKINVLTRNSRFPGRNYISEETADTFPFYTNTPSQYNFINPIYICKYIKQARCYSNYSPRKKRKTKKNKLRNSGLHVGPSTNKNVL